MTPLSVIDEIKGIYDRMHAEIARHAPVCQVSGRCCRFRDYDHTLFLSQPELDLLVSEGLPEGAVIDDASCPFQIKGLCTAREKRPLGCRVYFCDPNYEMTVGPEIAEQFTNELKEVHQRHELTWDYRPLHVHLTRFVETQSQQSPPGAKSDE